MLRGPIAPFASLRPVRSNHWSQVFTTGSRGCGCFGAAPVVDLCSVQRPPELLGLGGSGRLGCSESGQIAGRLTMFGDPRVRCRNGSMGPGRDRPDRETGLQVGRRHGGSRRAAPGRFATRRQRACSPPAGCWSKHCPWTIRRRLQRADSSSPTSSGTVMHGDALSRQEHCARAMLRVASKLTSATLQ